MLGDASNRKGRRIVAAGAPPWMTTFADLSTLLLSFFVLMLSFSEMDVEKYKQIAGSLQNAFGVQREDYAMDVPKGSSFVARDFAPGRPDPTPLKRAEQQTDLIPLPYLEGAAESRSPIGSERGKGAPDAVSAVRHQLAEDLVRIRALLDAEIRQGLVEVTRLGSRITIRIRERGSFPSGSAQLIEPFAPVLRKIARAIQLTEAKILVAGHTDNVPIHNRRFRSNWELSAARAVTLLHGLMRAAPLTPDRFVVQGYADTEPLVPNDTAANRARNRRVEVVLVYGRAAESMRSLERVLQSAEGGGQADA